MNAQRHFGTAALLATIAIAGQALIYLLTIVLARHLSLEGFEAYAVGSAAFTLMVSIAPLGLEKYSLRLLPALIERGDWRLSRGYIGIGLRRTLICAIALGAGVGLWISLTADNPSLVSTAVVISCVCLPAGALSHLVVEMLSATGREIQAAAIFRVFVPFAVLVFTGLALVLPVTLSGPAAVACWGVAWGLALALMILSLRRTTPTVERSAMAAGQTRAWQREALPFLAYRISLALLAQAGLIALEVLQPSAAAVGAFAAASGTATLVVVLASATNRFYARRLSILLEQQDYDEIQQLSRARLRWLLPCAAIFLVVVFGFGRELLTLFNPAFVEEGLDALRILAVAASFTVMFALSPTYLKYARHNRSVFGIAAGTAGTQIVLLIALVPSYGATGAASAYAISIVGMYAIYTIKARAEVAELRNAQPG